MTVSNVPVLPDWTRWSWSSLPVRDWYAPLFKRASAAFRELEFLSVAKGLRDGAWYNVAINELVSHTQRMQSLGLVVIPTDIRPSSLTYTNSVPLDGKGPLTARCLHVRPETFAKPIEFQTDEQIGLFLRYPHCCRRAFDDTWGKGQVDSTWEQFRRIDPDRSNLLASTLWRHMGLRLVPHLPCTFACEQSENDALEFLELGRQAGYVEELALIQEVQRWPATWSRLFGIAELTSPYLRVSTRTDWTATKDEWHLNGTSQPDITADLWQHNGFKSAAGMRKCHDLLLFSLKHAVEKDARICDLGCGNGILLRRLKMHRPDVRLSGVDSNRKAIESIPFGVGRWAASRIEDLTWVEYNPTTVLISVSRFMELLEEQRNGLRVALARVPQVLVYAYSDNLTQGPLEHQCGNLGLTVVPMVETPDVAMGILSPK